MNCNCKLSLSRRVEGLPDGLSPRIFAGLGRSALAEILARARHQRFTGASVVINEGDAAEHLYLLTSGQGAHSVITRDGRKILVYWLTAGQVFGGMAMLSSPSPYVASTEMHTPGCGLVWNRQTIREFAMRYPIILDNALSIAATEHCAWQLSARISIGTEEASVRVARLLVSLACGIGKSVPGGVEILVANEDLAGATAVTPYTVSRLTAEWQRAGIIIKKRGRIILRRPEQLGVGNEAKEATDMRRSVA
ncbi:Crp/Fnr family transcriptional regulator [Occallatibacter riparius]|uniref:Crp/Fnr family transcriptional regulator n=1 Tax=Occallatibacter riparius TaxID=1002689 RepID=A0A9J7BK95_9BACT|nr:Crp/Fnr family transcriptional regulator [Occallatibacter riparius]UWZ82995.1 Crp/Fnr family transcriptional regulator [Occallatibacter riparius]